MSVDWISQKITSTARAAMEFSDQGIPIDPESGSAISINRGRINASREAREKTVEDIVSALKRVRVDEEHRIDDLIREDDELQRKLYRMIHEKTIHREHPVDFRTSACRAELNIPAIIPALPFQYPQEAFPERIDMPLGTYYSSVIIDARRTGVRPMVLPSLYNEDGLEIYGRNYVDIRYAVRYGLVTFANSVKEAMNNPRAGEHPYYTVALKSLKGNPVLAEKDVKKIFGNNSTLAELRKCRVIFIIKKSSAEHVER